MNTCGYLDALKAFEGLRSDYALSKSLGVTTQAVSGWRSGVRHPDSLTCFEIARRLGLDPARVYADIERERAERSGRDGDASAWKAWVERLTSTTAAALLGAALIGPGDASATSERSVSAAPALKIMSTGMLALGRLLARILRVSTPRPGAYCMAA